MTPTLEGRLQTRLFLAVTVGLAWTIIIGPFLPEPAGVTVSASYAMAFASLLLMTFYGLVWEYFYYGLQQRRWDKDWPSVFVLLSVFNEAPVVWLLDHLFPVMSGAMAGMSGSSVAQSGSLGLSSPYLAGFVLHIGTTWVLMWLFSQGPLRVIFVRWRFEGGRIVSPRLADAPLPDAAGATLTRHPGVGQGQLTGAPAAVGCGELVEGGRCGHGHFGYPGLRYCLTCGRVVSPLTGPRGYGRRPPLGILIFEDGATHVLDGDVRLAPVGGPGHLTAGPRGEIPAASALADIRLAGWQPTVSSESHRIVLARPSGGQLHVAPGVRARLMPGAEFTVGGHQIRYESPYQPAGADLARAAPQIQAVPEGGRASAHHYAGRVSAGDAQAEG
jgi:hypothetical protein